jgi:lipopolysaccharide export system permease protein
MSKKWLHLNVLDKYVAGKFTSTFLFAILVCSLISVVIDYSDKVQNIVDKKPPYKEIFIDYYLSFVLHMANTLMPLYILIAVVFFTTRMAANNEIISMLNAGVSFRRLLRPYLLVAICVTIFQLVTSHFIVPITNKARLRFEHKYVMNQEKVRGSTSFFMVSPNEQITVRSYDNSAKTIRDFRLERLEGSKIVATLEAADAVWSDTTGKWRLSNYVQRTFKGMEESITLGGTNMLDTFINLTPTDFTWSINQNQEMTSPELMHAVARSNSRGSADSLSFETEVHRRNADATTIIILTIIGLAMAGRKVRGGVGVHLAMAIGIGALFILLSKFAVTLGANGVMSPSIAVWIPNLLFGSVAIYLAHHAQK